MSFQDSPSGPEKSISRREFFKRLGSGLLAAAVVADVPRSLILKASSAASGRGTLGTWNESVFAALVGQAFTLYAGAKGKVQVKLSAVQDGIAKVYYGPNRIVNAQAGDCYILSFRGPAALALRQNTYGLEQTQLGKFSLLLVPGVHDKAGSNYTAVINHVHA
jgi:hypothetical protein